MLDDPQGFCVYPHGQKTRLPGVWRHPPFAEDIGHLNALPLKFRIAIRSHCHHRRVADPQTRITGPPDTLRARQKAAPETLLDSPFRLGKQAVGARFGAWGG
jgi:hypothetical protein